MRKLTIKLKLEIETDLKPKDLEVTVYGLDLTVDNKIFRYGFTYDNIEALASWGKVKFEVDLTGLDVDTFVDEWIQSGFIDEGMSDNEIEDEVFNIIKRASMISGFNIEIKDKNTNEEFTGEIELAEYRLFDVKDMVDDSMINLLDLKVDKFVEMNNVVI